MRAEQKRNRGRIAPRFKLLLENLAVPDLDLVSQGFLRHALFLGGLEGKRTVGLLRSSGFWQPLQRNVPSQSDRAQGPDPVPVWIDLVPGKAVSRCLRNCMMIVMPALPKSKNGYPEAVGRGIARQEALRAPHVCGGVYKPGGVKAENSSDENAPHQVRQSTNDEQENAKQRQRNPVPLADPDVELVFAKIGHVRQWRVQLVVHRLAGQNPSHVGPKPAILWGVRVALFVRILVMHAMRGDPENRSALEGERRTGRQEILDPFRGLEAAVREEAMVAHADAETPRNPPQQNRHQERFPAKREECSDGANVKCDHEKRRNPIYGPRKRLVALKDIGHY